MAVPNTPDIILPSGRQQFTSSTAGEFIDLIMPLFNEKNKIFADLAHKTRHQRVVHVVNHLPNTADTNIDGNWGTDQVQMTLMHMAWQMSFHQHGRKLLWSKGTTINFLEDGEWAIL